jgi:hypothetical protein
MADGGIGEAMLLSAAMGGGSAALTGGDPLKGALLGGLTGGIGSGIGGMLGGAAPAAAAGATGAAGLGTLGSEASILGTLGSQVAPTASALGLSTGSTGLGLQAAEGSMGLNPALARAGMQGGTDFALNAPNLASGASNYALGAPSFAPGGSGIPSLLPNAVAPAAIPGAGSPPSFMEGMSKIAQDPTKYIMDNKYKLGASALAGAIGGREKPGGPEEYNGPLKRFRFNPETYRAAFAGGGITNLASGGYDHVVGDESMNPAFMARGGIADLGGYSDGGRMLRGPGDGMSDSIPASIAGRRPARLANEEFVVPADVVSHLGNGSSDAGAKQLYAMMDKVRQARTGRKSQGREINPQKYMPA